MRWTDTPQPTSSKLQQTAAHGVKMKFVVLRAFPQPLSR
jgi:hypothetical protein